VTLEATSASSRAPFCSVLARMVCYLFYSCQSFGVDSFSLQAAAQWDTQGASAMEPMRKRW